MKRERRLFYFKYAHGIDIVISFMILTLVYFFKSEIEIFNNPDFDAIDSLRSTIISVSSIMFGFLFTLSAILEKNKSFENKKVNDFFRTNTISLLLNPSLFMILSVIAISSLTYIFTYTQEGTVALLIFTLSLLNVSLFRIFFVYKLYTESV